MKTLFKTFTAVILAGLFAATAVVAEESTTMLLYDFMEDYAKPASKLAEAGNTEPMMRVLAAIPNMALENDKQEWQQLIDKAVAAEKPGGSCRACHRNFKKTYQKQHEDHQVRVSNALIAYLQAAQQR